MGYPRPSIEGGLFLCLSLKDFAISIPIVYLNNLKRLGRILGVRLVFAMGVECFCR